MLPIKQIFKRIIQPIGRGLFKGALPGVSGAIEAIRNTKGVEVTVTTPGGEQVTGLAKPHSWLSIIPSLLAAGFMIYLFVTKQLTEDQIESFIEVVIEILKGSI